MVNLQRNKSSVSMPSAFVGRDEKGRRKAAVSENV